MTEENRSPVYEVGDLVGSDDSATAAADYVRKLVEQAKGAAPAAPVVVEKPKPGIVERLKSAIFPKDEPEPAAPADPLAVEPDELQPGHRWGLRAADGVPVQVSTAPEPTELLEYGKHVAHPTLSSVSELRRAFRAARAERDQAAAHFRQTQKRYANLKAAAIAGGIGDVLRLLEMPEPPLPEMQRVRVAGLVPFTRNAERPSGARAVWFEVNHGRPYTPQQITVESLGQGHTFDVPDFLLDDLVSGGFVEVVDPSTPRAIPAWATGQIRREHARQQQA